MSITRIMSYASGVIATICLVPAIVERFFIVTRALLGLSALAYLRFSSTMLLFTIAFMMLEFTRKRFDRQ